MSKIHYIKNARNYMLIFDLSWTLNEKKISSSKKSISSLVKSKEIDVELIFALYLAQIKLNNICREKGYYWSGAFSDN